VATTIDLTPAGDTLDALGATTQLSATVRDQFGQVIPGATVSWASDDAAIASVDASSGIVTAVAPGEATIRAASGPAQGMATIRVHQVAVSARVSLEEWIIQPDSTTLVTIQAFDANSHEIPSEELRNREIAWASSDPEVAEVWWNFGEGPPYLLTGGAPGLTLIRGEVDGVNDTQLLSVAWSSSSGMGVTFRTDTRGEGAVWTNLEGGYHIQILVQDEMGQPIPDARVNYAEEEKVFLRAEGPGDRFAPAFLWTEVEGLEDHGEPYSPPTIPTPGHPGGLSEASWFAGGLRIVITIPSVEFARLSRIQDAYKLETFLYQYLPVEFGLQGPSRGRICMTWSELVEFQRVRFQDDWTFVGAVMRLVRESSPSYFDPDPVPGEAVIYYSDPGILNSLTGGDLLAQKIELLGAMLDESATDREVEVEWDLSNSGRPAGVGAPSVLHVRTNDLNCGGGLPEELLPIQDTIRGSPSSTHWVGVLAYGPFGLPVPDLNIAFGIQEGHGSIAGLTPTGTWRATDEDGRAEVEWTLPEDPGIYEMKAWVLGTDLPETTIYGIVEESSPTTLDPTPTDLAAGNTHTCALTPDNTAYCWGRGADGELGNGASGAGAHRPTPFEVDVDAGTLVALSVGESHSCGLAADGTAYCWGQNQYHETGAGERWFPVTTPQQVSVPNGLKFQSISPGSTHTCGLDKDGQAYCWGSNDQGQLGDGVTTDPRGTAAPVAGDRTYIVVASGGIHACGLDEAGKAWCWGDNRYGQLDPDASDVEVRMEPDTMLAQPAPFVDLVAGWYHTCGLTADRTAYCWGWNIYGQLGTGTNEPQVSPLEPVTLGSGLQQLDAGGGHTCAIGSDGLTYCWGRNENGQVGNGTKMARYSPTLVSGGHTFAVLSVGAFHTCGLTPEGKAWCWGDGANWQLGYGDFDPFSEDPDRLVPTEVAGGLVFGRPASAPAVSWNPAPGGPWSPFWRWIDGQE
jgi:hypothetical protein